MLPALPPLRTTLPALLAAAACRHADKPAVVFGDVPLRYGELAARADAWAAGLRQAGVAPGERVLLLGQNSIDWVAACYGVWRAGAVVVPASPMSTARELQHLLDDSGAVRVLASRELQSLARHRVGADGVLAIDTLPAAPPLAEPLPHDPDAPCLLPYTSGTTGRPKGCLHTHATLLASLHASATWRGLHGGSVFLSTAPLFHMLGLQNGMNLPLSLGATVVMLPRWDAAAAAALIERHRVSTWTAPPTMLGDFFNDPQALRHDLSSLTLIAGGGAALSDALSAQMRRRLGLTYNEAYGLTETASLLHANPVHAPKRGCLGQAVYGVDSRIVDPATLRELPTGEAGEIVTHAPQTMLGYWRNPQADAQAFFMRDGKRFFRTGDLGCVDAEGYFFMRDRLKRMINAAGYKVWPAELEALLAEHPALREACVVSAPDARRGETVRAVVVLRDGAALADGELAAWCRERVAAYKVPRIVEQRAALPRSASGKIDWRTLQDEPSHLNTGDTP